ANAGSSSFASLVLDDSGDTASQHFNIGANTMGITGKLNIVTLVSSETLFTGSAGNTIDVTATAATNTLNLNLGKGNDTVNVLANNSATFPTEHILGPVNINSGGAAYTLNYSDKGGTAGQSYTLTSSKLTRTNEALITYSQGATVNITGGSGSNTFTGASVPTAPPPTITRGGADTPPPNNTAPATHP